MRLKANIKKCVYPYQLLILCAIKGIDKNLYNKMKFNQISIGQLITNLEKCNANIISCIGGRESCVFRAYLIWILNDNNEIERLRENKSKVEESN